MRRWFVTGAICAALCAGAAAQIATKKKPSQGPRALGILEIAANGKAHLIPVTILYNGQYYDAGAYKASPIPMALEPQTVYEGEKSGVSQGLFTITEALQRKNNWIAAGNWRPMDKGAAKKALAPVHTPAAQPEEMEKPPVLKRPGSPTGGSGSSSSSESTTGASASPSSGGTSGTNPQATSGAQPTNSTAEGQGSGSSAPSGERGQQTPAAPGQTPTATSGTPAQSSPAAPSQQDDSAPPPDADRPKLRRGPPQKAANESEEESEPVHASVASKPATAAKPAAIGKSPVGQIMPAISDAAGPEPHPYTYDLKSEEQQRFRTKMLTLADADVTAYVKKLQAEQIEAEPSSGKSRTSTSSRAKTSAKSTSVAFDDVQLHVFDLSSSNEPVIVLTATAKLPQPAGRLAMGPVFVTLVARNDIYDELHKITSNVTDGRHLDVTPKLELIDAVDVDGDARGELLFREISDAGTAYLIDRVIGDQLYTLFQGAPGE